MRDETTEENCDIYKNLKTTFEVMKNLDEITKSTLQFTPENDQHYL